MNQDQGRKRRRLIGIGFVLAFLLSTATIIYTGLNVRAPGTAREANREVSESPPPAAQGGEQRSQGDSEPDDDESAAPVAQP
jgi:hypothetical protein